VSGRRAHASRRCSGPVGATHRYVKPVSALRSGISVIRALLSKVLRAAGGRGGGRASGCVSGQRARRGGSRAHASRRRRSRPASRARALTGTSGG
jgi:hypothetical protein